MAVIPIIIEQHAEEAAFQWLLRDAAVTAPHYSLKDLADLDDRVEANIDGLRIAGDEGWNICMENLPMEHAGEVFALAVLGFESGIEDRIQAVLEAGGQEPELTRGIVSALGWLPYSQVEIHIQKLLKSELPHERMIGIVACALHRQDPGKPLKDALSAEDNSFKARALKVVGELGKSDLLPYLKKHLMSDDEECRFFAAWSSALLGDIAASSVLRSVAEKGGKYSVKACIAAMVQMRLSDCSTWFKVLSANKKNTRIAAIGAGAMGDPVSIPWLIEQMANPEQARVAGEAFSMITGVDIAYIDLEGEWPEGFEAGPTEDPEDENVEMDADEDLPWPDQDLIKKWWEKNGRNFKKGTPYFLGKPVTPPWLEHVLVQGKQRQRAYAALRQTMMQPGKPLFEVRAPGFRQTGQLKK